jgi:AbrB family looped-hinge helix DNA binding protein
LEEILPIVVITTKGQVTIPKEVRKGLNLASSDRVIIVLEGEQAVIKPIRGTLLDIGGSLNIPEKSALGLTVKLKADFIPSALSGAFSSSVFSSLNLGR